MADTLTQLAQRVDAGVIIYHGTPLTPRDAFEAIMPGRATCISYYTPKDVDVAEALCPYVMYDNGAFSFWRQAVKAGNEWDQVSRDWKPYYAWLEARLWHPGRWAVIPDSPGAPSQINDGLLNDNPFGRSRMAPLWHMDGPIERLGRLCERYDRVCLGWIGNPKKEPVGCDSYRRCMDEVSAFMGNRWHPIHMMRGVAVARDYPFRERRQHKSRSKRVAIRQPYGHVLGRQVAWAKNLRAAAGSRLIRAHAAQGGA